MAGAYRMTSASRPASLSAAAAGASRRSPPSNRVGSCSTKTTVWPASFRMVRSWSAVNGLRTSKFEDVRLIPERSLE